ncbi:MAG TPA: hypothetical protein VGB17_04390 [Pyrinomonadaceae bacterium]
MGKGPGLAIAVGGGSVLLAASSVVDVELAVAPLWSCARVMPCKAMINAQQIMR